MDKTVDNNNAGDPLPIQPPKKKKKKLSISRSLLQALRRRILVGLVTVIPIALAAFVFILSINWIYNLFEPIIKPLFLDKVMDLLGLDPENKSLVTRGLDIVALVLAVSLFISALYITGLLSSTFIVRRFIHIGESIVDRIPGIKTVYKGSKQIVESVSRPKKKSFREVVLVQYPKVDSWVIAFVTGKSRIQNTGETFINVFVPTTPNPTSGFLMLLPAQDIRATNLTVEDAVKFVMSAGIVVADNLQTVSYDQKYLLPKTAQVSKSSEPEQIDDEDGIESVEDKTS